jgi:hypothetical protein
MKRQKAVVLAEHQTRGRADEDADLARLNAFSGITNATSDDDRDWQIALPVVSAMARGCSRSLEIPIRPTPSILMDDISQRDTADWPEPAHRVADRQQGIGVDTGRQPERGLRLLLEL